MQEQENLNCNWWIVGGSEWTSVWVKNSRETHSQEGPHALVGFSSRNFPGFSQWLSEENTLMLLAGRREKKQFWNIPELAHNKLFYQSLTNYWGFFRQLAFHMEGKKYPTADTSSYSVQPKWMKKYWEALVRCTDQRHRLT